MIIDEGGGRSAQFPQWNFIRYCPGVLGDQDGFVEERADLAIDQLKAEIPIASGNRLRFLQFQAALGDRFAGLRPVMELLLSGRCASDLNGYPLLRIGLRWIDANDSFLRKRTIGFEGRDGLFIGPTLLAVEKCLERRRE